MNCRGPSKLLTLLPSKRKTFTLPDEAFQLTLLSSEALNSSLSSSGYMKITKGASHYWLSQRSPAPTSRTGSIRPSNQQHPLPHSRCQHRVQESEHRSRRHHCSLLLPRLIPDHTRLDHNDLSQSQKISVDHISSSQTQQISDVQLSTQSYLGTQMIQAHTDPVDDHTADKQST